MTRKPTLKAPVHTVYLRGFLPLLRIYTISGKKEYNMFIVFSKISELYVSYY